MKDCSRKAPCKGITHGINKQTQSSLTKPCPHFNFLLRYLRFPGPSLGSDIWKNCERTCVQAYSAPPNGADNTANGSLTVLHRVLFRKHTATVQRVSDIYKQWWTCVITTRLHQFKPDSVFPSKVVMLVFFTIELRNWKGFCDLTSPTLPAFRTRGTSTVSWWASGCAQ